MKNKNVGSLLVSDGDGVIGILTRRDVLWRVVLERLDPVKTLVKDVMSTPVITVKPGIPLADAVQTMKTYDIKHLPVVSDGNAYGIITTVDIAFAIPKILADGDEVATISNLLHEWVSPYQ